MSYKTGTWHDLPIIGAEPITGIEIPDLDVYFLCRPDQIDEQGGINVAEGEDVEIVSVKPCISLICQVESKGQPKVIGYSGTTRQLVDSNPTMDTEFPSSQTIASHGPVFYEMRLIGPGRFSSFRAEL